MKDLKDFKLSKETKKIGCWVTILDGEMVKPHNKVTCETKGAISSSFSQGLNYYKVYLDYGFKSSKEMKEALIESGRLKFKNLLEDE